MPPRLVMVVRTSLSIPNTLTKLKPRCSEGFHNAAETFYGTPAWDAL